MIYFGLKVQNYILASLTHEFKNEIGSEDIEIHSYPLIPTNISVMPESLPTGHLHLSSTLPNGTAAYTRNSTDELFPFQLDRWYQHFQFWAARSETLEMYLKAIWHIVERSNEVKVSFIAKLLDTRQPSVVSMLHKLNDENFVET
jgi:hypothetical protein